MKKGFTLIEVLLVVAIIAILAGIVILAVNPGKQLGDSRNAERRADVNTIVNALYQYSVDNNGGLPAGIDTVYTTAQVIGTDSSGCDSSCTASSTTVSCIDLRSALVPTYLVGLPVDPSSGSNANTDYYVDKLGNGRLVVGSCDPEQGKTIQVQR